MWSPVRRGRIRLSLAGQFLALQLMVLLVVLAFAAVVLTRQSDSEFRDDRGTTLRASAQQLANLEPIRSSLTSGDIFESLAGYVATTQSRNAATYVALASPDGTIVMSVDPDDVGRQLDLDHSDVQEMRMWTGDVTVDGKRAFAAQVPVVFVPPRAQNEPPRVVGIVMVSEPYPTLADRVDRWLPDLARFLGIGLAVGLLGAWLLSRLIKRRTRGLEPVEIAALADQREAVLHSIREGVVVVAPDGTMTVLSDSARELLGIDRADEGTRVADLSLDEHVRAALEGTDDVHDQVLVVGGRVIVLNRNRVMEQGRQVGTVTTLRDRTELLAMQSELSARESITETLRAQTHEFNNQLHTISGLVQLEEYAEVSALIGNLTRKRAEISEFVTKRVDDPAVAALLIAKSSLAAERGVTMVLAGDSSLPRLDPDLSADVGTVLGNLVDNAVDATVASGGRRVDVHVLLDDAVVLVQVADTGPGVTDTTEIFRRGYSTKPSDASGRGVGLALVQVVCERRGGMVSVHNDEGAVFTARLPLEART
ncbi:MULTISPECIES: sensor histidine kinase [unclassified Nocardioides]|uniref:sensor histidine kinase n=1 Tax=unclassified Nocardioides TaxID=2615069 RepID=UPI0006F7A838|nr:MULTISPECIES: ATP-binding protein [unclassified Nocardioides]KQY63778.1 hypothetical protein ASD30_01935 [Nocardioides sp. Root140]KRF15793.1 hypothetical protein ASH02_03930 [Nocardioides sp. Soil796]